MDSSTSIVWFLAGGLYTLTLLLVGLSLGYFYGAKEEKLAKRRARVSRLLAKLPSRQTPSGSIPHKTAAEAEAEERAPLTKRIGELFYNNQPPPPPGDLIT